MYFRKKQRISGFTLIELLVVIAIISLLASVVFAALNTARAKARDAKRISEVRELITALDLYYDENGAFPISGSCGATSPNGGWCNSVESLSDGHWVRNGTTNLDKFLGEDPLDPKQGGSPNWRPYNGGTIFYFARGYGGSGQWYMIVFGLESYPNAIEDIDGVVACNGRNFHYGNGSNGIVTIGASCQ